MARHINCHLSRHPFKFYPDSMFASSLTMRIMLQENVPILPQRMPLSMRNPSSIPVTCLALFSRHHVCYLLIILTICPFTCPFLLMVNFDLDHRLSHQRLSHQSRQRISEFPAEPFFPRPVLSQRVCSAQWGVDGTS